MTQEHLEQQHFDTAGNITHTTLHHPIWKAGGHPERVRGRNFLEKLVWGGIFFGKLGRGGKFFGKTGVGQI